MGNARCAANKDQLTAEFRPDQAGDRAEALYECFTQWCGDSGIGRRHVAEVRDKKGGDEPPKHPVSVV